MKGRVDEGAQPAVTKLGEFYPEPPGIVLPAPVTAATPVDAARRKISTKELETEEATIVATSRSPAIRNFFEEGFIVECSDGVRSTALAPDAQDSSRPWGEASAAATKDETVAASHVELFIRILI